MKLERNRGVGSPNTAGVVASEETYGNYHETTLRLANVTVAITDEAGVVAYVGTKIYDFPEGAILFLGASARVDIQTSSAGVNTDWDGDFGLGTVTASNNNSLSSTEQNLIPTTATAQASGGGTVAAGASTSTEAAKVIDGAATPVDVYLNVLVDDADHDVGGTACNFIYNGLVKIKWIQLGDY